MKIFLALAIALSLSACLKIDTIKEAFQAKQGLDNVAQMVVACVKGTPTEQAIAKPFNYLVDLKENTKDMQPNKEAIKQIIGGRETVRKAGVAWVSVKTEIRNSGLTCDPRLADEAAKVEVVYDDVVNAIETNERLVVALEWTELLGSMVGGPAGQVIKLSAQAAQ